MAAFPGTLFNPIVDDITLGQLQAKDLDDATYDHATVHRSDAGEIVSTQTKIGTGSSVQTSLVKHVLYGDGTGTSLWETDITLNSLTIDTTLAVTTNVTVGGTLAVTGNTALNGTGNTLASADFTGVTRISNNTKHQFEALAGTVDAAIWEDASDDLILDSTNEIKFQINNEADVISADDWLTGWWPVQETWTFASDDDPTYTFTVPTDLTTKYTVGTKIKLTDSGTQYFIVTKVAYGAPNTTVTLYGGNAHAQGELSGGAITVPYFARDRAPAGFSLDPDDWTEKVSDATDNAQTPPVANTWYNLGTITIDIPIGCWNVEYVTSTYVFDAVATQNIIANIYTTLSKANNTEDDTEFTSESRNKYYISGVSTTFEDTMDRHKVLNLSTKDTYYLNAKTSTANISEIQFLGSSRFPTILKAVCAYI